MEQIKSHVHIVERQKGQATPITIKFRIHPKYVQRIAHVLAPKNRSTQEEKTLVKSKARLATAMKNDPYAYKRTDAAGNRQSDNGKQFFSNGKKGNQLRPAELWNDLMLAGYNITEVYSFKKDNDNMVFLCFKLTEVPREVSFPQEVEDLLILLLEKSFDHVHMWDNPNGSITINCAHIKVQDTFPMLRVKLDPKGIKFYIV